MPQLDSLARRSWLSCLSSLSLSFPISNMGILIMTSKMTGKVIHSVGQKFIGDLLLLKHWTRHWVFPLTVSKPSFLVLPTQFTPCLRIIGGGKVPLLMREIKCQLVC